MRIGNFSKNFLTTYIKKVRICCFSRNSKGVDSSNHYVKRKSVRYLTIDIPLVQNCQGDKDLSRTLFQDDKKVCNQCLILNPRHYHFILSEIESKNFSSESLLKMPCYFGRPTRDWCKKCYGPKSRLIMKIHNFDPIIVKLCQNGQLMKGIWPHETIIVVVVVFIK